MSDDESLEPLDVQGAAEARVVHRDSLRDPLGEPLRIIEKASPLVDTNANMGWIKQPRSIVRISQNNLAFINEPDAMIPFEILELAVDALAAKYQLPNKQ